MIRWCDNGHPPTRVLSGRRCGACDRRRALSRGPRVDLRERATPSARGYGHAHQQARAQLVAMLPTPCGYGCGVMLTTSAQLVAAHVVDGDPTEGYLPSCRGCNERAKRLPRGVETAGSMDRTKGGFSHVQSRCLP